jgi:hypothetical protein
MDEEGLGERFGFKLRLEDVTPEMVEGFRDARPGSGGANGER